MAGGLERGRMLPVYGRTSRDARALHCQFAERVERAKVEAQRLLAEDVRTGLEDGADSRGMENRRARDVDEVRRLPIEHESQVVVDAGVLEQPHRELTPLGNRLMNRDDADVLTREPARQVPSRGNFTETRNRAAQFHIQVRAISSSSFA